MRTQSLVSVVSSRHCYVAVCCRQKILQGEFICYEFEDDSVRFGVPDLSRGQYSLLLTEQQVESDADSCDSSSKSRLDQELDSGEQSDDEDPMALLSPS